jgi:hypothetical protein
MILKFLIEFKNLNFFFANCNHKKAGVELGCQSVVKYMLNGQKCWVQSQNIHIYTHKVDGKKKRKMRGKVVWYAVIFIFSIINALCSWNKYTCSYILMWAILMADIKCYREWWQGLMLFLQFEWKNPNRFF